jgi:hypothetical protein
MIAQWTNTHVLLPLRVRANLSVRSVLSFYLFSAGSHFGSACRLNSLVNSNGAASLHDHPHSNVCSARCPRYNPHRQTLLLHPTL